MSFFIEEMKYLQHTRKKSVADCCFVGLLLLLLNPSIQHIIILHSRKSVSCTVRLRWQKKKRDARVPIPCFFAKHWLAGTQ